MNNGRYLTMLDLMLIEYFVRFGFFGLMLKQGWRPMAGGSFITYRRGLKPFQRYTLRFRTEGSAPRATGGLLAFRGGGFDANYNTREPFTFFLAVAALYLVLTSVSLLALRFLEKRYSVGIKAADL